MCMKRRFTHTTKYFLVMTVYHPTLTFRNNQINKGIVKKCQIIQKAFKNPYARLQKLSRDTFMEKQTSIGNIIFLQSCIFYMKRPRQYFFKYKNISNSVCLCFIRPYLVKFNFYINLTLISKVTKYVSLISSLRMICAKQENDQQYIQSI